MKKDNEKLRDAIDQALQEIIDDGTYEEISQKWFKRNLLDIDLEDAELLE